MISLSKETDQDGWEVEYLYDLSFAPGREALSSYQLRRDVPPVADLCLVARDDYNNLAGAIRYWPVSIGQLKRPALLLGPIAVHPTRQGEGIGGVLIRDSLERAKEIGWTRVMLIGDEPYYRKFGFSVAKTLSFPPPTNPERLLCKALRHGAFYEVTGLVGPFADR